MKPENHSWKIFLHHFQTGSHSEIQRQHEQWPKPWLVVLYRGLYYPVILGNYYFINHEIRIPINQPGYQWKVSGSPFVFFSWLNMVHPPLLLTRSGSLRYYIHFHQVFGALPFCMASMVQLTIWLELALLLSLPRTLVGWKKHWISLDICIVM